MISVLLPRFAQAHTGLDGSTDVIFNRIDFFGNRQHPVLVFARDHHDPVAVSADEIAMMDARWLPAERGLCRCASSNFG
jgi:hypothetical protein